MVLYKIALIIYFCSAVSGFIYPQEYPNRKIDLLIKDGITKLLNHNYDSAKVVFKSLDEDYQNLPLGKIYLAAVGITKFYDLSEDFNEKYLDSILNLSTKQSENLIEENPHNIWNIYFLALSEGYTAYYKALNSDWLSAINSGTNSIKYFEECLKLNNNFYEAFTAIGTFKYWKSRKTELVEFLPFFEDEKEEGISYLKKAIEYSSHNSYLAINSLIWIYIDKGDFNSAINMAEKVLKVSPDCRIFKWGLARAYEEIDIKKTINIYYEILSSYNDKKKLNKINEIILKHKIAQQYAKLNEDIKALELCEEILIIRLSDNEKNKVKDRLKRVKELKELLEK